MHLYLVQHAEAKREEEDPERPLTEKGRDDIARVSRFVAQHAVPRVVRILHSGKTRARQTAEILADHFRPPGGLQQQDGLAPLDDPRIIARLLAESSEDLALVGHLPHLSKLSGLLLCGNEGRMPVEFTMGGIVALARDASGVWSVRWAIVPDVLPR